MVHFVVALFYHNLLEAVELNLEHGRCEGLVLVDVDEAFDNAAC